MTLYTIYISLGSNLEPSIEHLKQGIHQLKELGDLTVSSFYKTPAWGVTDQSDFINACAILKTTLTPEQVLEQAQAIEKKQGRVRHRHWGERTLDIDLLHAVQHTNDTEQNYFSDTDTLKLPHPFLFDRAFVLVPLLEIAPDFEIHSQSAYQAVQKLNDRHAIEKLNSV